MKLAQKQQEFTKCLVEFIVQIYGGRVVWDQKPIGQIRMGETYRPPFTAKEYARLGKGIVNSAHCKKLAADLFLSLDGTSVTWKNDDYAPLAEMWESLHPLARAGHYFRGRDSVHFSFEHNGIR
jgi:hypothetical protein